MRRSIGLLVIVLVAIGATLASPQGAQAASPRGHDIYYGRHWVDRTVHSPATADKYLHGASTQFKHFAARRGAKLRKAAIASGASRACVRATGIQVERYHTRGFAYGGIGGCGGAIALWARVAGQWHAIVTTQDVIYCTTLRKHGVPSSVVRRDSRPATCFDRAKNAEVRYRHH